MIEFITIFAYLLFGFLFCEKVLAKVIRQGFDIAWVIAGMMFTLLTLGIMFGKDFVPWL